MSKKIKALSILATLALTASMAVPAFAADENGEVGGAVPTDNGTQVWAGVAVDEPDMRVRVTVPTLFAFVVNGTVDSTKASQAVTVENDGLLLPNVKVTNASGTAEDGQSYKLVTEGKSDLKFTNYSTQKGEDDAITNRKGLAVTLKGTIQNEGTAESRNPVSYTHLT